MYMWCFFPRYVRGSYTRVRLLTGQRRQRAEVHFARRQEREGVPESAYMLQSNRPAHLQGNLSKMSYIHTYIHTYILYCIHQITCTFLYACMHFLKYIHTYIHVHRYLYTYINTANLSKYPTLIVPVPY